MNSKKYINLKLRENSKTNISKQLKMQQNDQNGKQKKDVNLHNRYSGEQLLAKKFRVPVLPLSLTS